LAKKEIVGLNSLVHHKFKLHADTMRKRRIMKLFKSN
jgi:hypothetical protein